MYVFKIPAPTTNIIVEAIWDFLRTPWGLAITLSGIWLAWRIGAIFLKPMEELEEIFGIDIHPVPDVALARISGNSVLLYWKPPETYNSPLKHLIQVNGINVGEFEKSDMTIQITGLEPGNCYGIRAVATNQSGYSSYSGLIQVQTVPSDGNRTSNILADVKKKSQSRRISQPLLGPDGSVVAATEMRERSNTSDESQLTMKMEALKQQTTKAETQLVEDRAENERGIADLIDRRDSLKKQTEEHDKEYQELKKRVLDTEKQCKLKQRKKSSKERSLHAKRAERRKMEDEIARWKTEAEDTHCAAKQCNEDIIIIEAEHEVKMTEVQKMIEEKLADCGRMEEELRELGIKVKDLDEERARADEEKYTAEAEAEQRREADEQQSEEHIQRLQMEYSSLWRLANTFEQQSRMHEERVSNLMRHRERQPELFAPIPGLDYPMPPTFPATQRYRPSSLRGGLAPTSHVGGHGHHHTFNSTSSLSPSFAAALLHNNLGSDSPENGEYAQMTQSEIDYLTAGAPMSPSANTLLPSDLLAGDDDEPVSRFARPGLMRKEGSISRPHSFRPSSTEPKREDPQSPLSMHSGSPSLLSSPRESLSNIHSSLYGRRDDDENSLPIHSSPFSLQPTIGMGSSRKISGLFGWTRREKGRLNEPPLLGTLKQGQSQSFPLNSDEDSDIGAHSRRKTTNIWQSTVGFWNRGAAAPPNISDISDRTVRKGIFGSKLEASEGVAQSSSRPSSLYSFGDSTHQQSLEYPQYGFGTPDSSRGRKPIADWSSFNHGPWSHTQSRRPSIQHGSTSNLSLGSTPLGPREEDSASLPPNKRVSRPAPIGTERFRISQRPNTPKLNPAAPSFKATRLFTRGESKKTPKAEKSFDFGAEKSKSQVAGKPRDFDAVSKTSSPAISRKSQDAFSVATADSMDESHDSLEPSNSGSPSELAMTPGSGTPKESLMQRLQRKSSNTKFWTKNSSKTSSKGAPSTPGEVDDEHPEGLLGRSVESSSSTPHDKRGSLSWSRVIGKGRRKGDPAPSESSGRASEAEGDDDD